MTTPNATNSLAQPGVAQIEAAVLLITLAIIIVVETSSVSREITIRRYVNGYAASNKIWDIRRLGSFPLIHLFNITILTAAFVYVTAVSRGGALDVATVPLAVLLYLFPVLEIDFIDEMILKPSPEAVLLAVFHLIYIITLLTYQGEILRAVFYLLAGPIIATFVFCVLLIAYVEKLDTAV